jgi:GNAT superfamily N-acetyltransferase
VALTIRKAGKNDASDLGRLHIEGWRASYGGIVDQTYLDALDVEKRAADWQRWFDEGKMDVLLALDPENKPCGFASFGKLKTPVPGMSPIRPLYTAEIYAIYILPTHWRQGIGRELLKQASLSLRNIKHRSLCLWVIQKNERAVEFYKSLGGQRCGKKDVEIGGKMLQEICFGWRDTKSLIGD